MEFLAPLGLMGLVGIIGWLVIYLIKPNYQQKFISSTFIWKRATIKKRIPISKLRNLLLIICQIMILALCGVILGQPVHSSNEIQYDEKVIILDASASMLTVGKDDEGEPYTRFERAVDEIKAYVEDCFKSDDSRVTIIVADLKAYILGDTVEYDENGLPIEGTESFEVMRASSADEEEVMEQLDTLISVDSASRQKIYKCSEGTGNIEQAMNIAEDVLKINPMCNIVLFTDTQYLNSGNVEVRDVRSKEENIDGSVTYTERNVGLLSGVAEINASNVFSFSVDVASYGATQSVMLQFIVNGANGTADSATSGTTFAFYQEQECREGETVTFTINTADYDPETVNVTSELSSGPVSAYRNCVVSIYRLGNVDVTAGQCDAFGYDDEYRFYDGIKPELKIEYISSLPNPFMRSILSGWKASFGDTWSVTTKEVDTEVNPNAFIDSLGNNRGYDEGYDLYIFEHEAIPASMPRNGVSIILSPSDLKPELSDTGIEVIGITTFDEGNPSTMVLGEGYNPILKNLTFEDVTVRKFTRMSKAHPGYDALLYLSGKDLDGNTMVEGTEYTESPLLLVSNAESGKKHIIFNVNINWSTFAMSFDFPMFYANILREYFPQTINKYVYDVGEVATVNAIANVLEYRSPIEDENIRLTEFPAQIDLNAVGAWNITQTKYVDAANPISTDFFVKVPEVQSNIHLIEDRLINPYIENSDEMQYDDLLIYFAAALVAFVFFEWCLQIKGNF